MSDVAKISSRDRYTALHEHISEFFGGQQITVYGCEESPLLNSLPDLRVYCIAPKHELGQWVYISAGASEVQHENFDPLEFMLVAPKQSDRFIELLTWTASYNIVEPLNLGHTFPVGEPWFEDSSCDYFLLTLPYLHGQNLEICCLTEEHIHIYWLLPITKAEKDFIYEHSRDALEELFEQKELEYCRPDRKSIV